MNTFVSNQFGYSKKNKTYFNLSRISRITIIDSKEYKRQLKIIFPGDVIDDTWDEKYSGKFILALHWIGAKHPHWCTHIEGFDTYEDAQEEAETITNTNQKGGN